MLTSKTSVNTQRSLKERYKQLDNFFFNTYFRSFCLDLCINWLLTSYVFLAVKYCCTFCFTTVLACTNLFVVMSVLDRLIDATIDTISKRLASSLRKGDVLHHPKFNQSIVKYGQVKESILYTLVLENQFKKGKKVLNNFKFIKGFPWTSQLITLDTISLFQRYYPKLVDEEEAMETGVNILVRFTVNRINVWLMFIYFHCFSK